MLVLGISSATKIISIGLVDEDRILVDKTVPDIHAELVIHYIKKARIKPEQIDGVAVAVGPGSYSGLRGGLATAKTLAQTLNIPLVGVSTLEAIAYNMIKKEGTVVVILDAKSDDFNFALFLAMEGKLERQTADMVLKLNEIKERIPKIKGEVYQLNGNKAHPLGVNVARLGLLRIKADQTDDPLKLVPAYSHKPNIREYKLI